MVERYMPEDIVFDILIWLPVKSLIRFTCVSKKWRSKILYDPEFAKSRIRIQKYLSSQRLLLYTDTPAPQFKSLDLQFADKSLVEKLNNIPLKEDEKDEITLLGSSNGLVFLQVRYSEGIHIFIYNPLTGFFKKLPDPGFEMKYLHHYRLNYFGVGYLSVTDDYKVLVSHCGVFETRKESHEGPEVLELYSLRANLWKRIEEHKWKFEATHSESRGAYLNESLHWIGHHYSYTKRYMIVVFDLAEDEFRTMQLPDDFENIKYDYREIREEVGTLGVSGDCLCISSYPKDTCEESINLWIMREYGMPGSWTKLTLSCPNRHTIFNPFGVDVLFMESSTVVVNCTWRGTDFIRTEHKEEGKIALYMIKEDTYNQVIGYEESLVWIDGYHVGGVQEEKEAQTPSQEAAASSQDAGLTKLN